jgi:flavin-dependent dehydrogenase
LTDERYDVAIIGAGPAGTTAGNLLARKGRRVAIIEREKFPRAVPCAGWLNIRAKALLDELSFRFKPLDGAAFTDVTLYNADCTKSARPTFDGQVGYIIDRAAFDNALAEAAVAGGATLLQGADAVDLRLNETEVVVTIRTPNASAGPTLANEKRITSRLLIMAAGRGSPLAVRLGFVQRSAESPIWSAQIEGPIKSRGKSAAPRVAVILGLDGGGSFGFCCVSPARASLSVNWFGDPAPAVPALVRLCKLAAERGIMPIDLSGKAAAVKLIRSPAAAALDMDSHVAKHALLVGDAGGFVSAASNEGIYPAMWSAKIAAAVIDRALQSPYSQDELMSFDSAWRMEIADHLRSPHTDIRFLLPLIFSNQAMADRMGAAFFFGENI